MNNEILLVQALSMDLLRAAIGFNRKSIKMSKTFKKEAEKRIDQLIDQNSNNNYLNKLIEETKKQLESNQTNADHLLMYSILFKNYALKRLKDISK